jgi:hypothetical protein
MNDLRSRTVMTAGDNSQLLQPRETLQNALENSSRDTVLESKVANIPAGGF